MRDTLASKAKEYAREDRLYNFKRGAAFLGSTPESVCVGFLMKHVVSVMDIVEDLAKGKLPPREFVNEKLGDTINYFVLLEALLEDRRK
jgi:hypothetical protein